MRVLIIGGNGMLGHKLVQILGETFDVQATIRGKFFEIERFGIFDRNRIIESVDANDMNSLKRAIEIARPDVVINAVGAIKQLPASNDVIRSLTVNSIFPHRLAEFSREYGFRLILISTDCVFDGKKGTYTEGDIADARDIYGMSKILGEITNADPLTIRTSIIGRELLTKNSIVEWFLSNRGGRVKGYTNAIYTGFPSEVLAEILAGLITHHPDLAGLYHISSGPITKFHLLELLNQYFEADVNIEPSDEVAIDRSLDSSKFRAATGFEPAGWEDMIAQMANSHKPYDLWQ